VADDVQVTNRGGTAFRMCTAHDPRGVIVPRLATVSVPKDLFDRWLAENHDSPLRYVIEYPGSPPAARRAGSHERVGAARQNLHESGMRWDGGT